MTAGEIAKKRHELALAHGYSPVPSPENQKVGIALNVRTALRPIHGVRCLPENGTTGWYIWAGGEMSEDLDFFKPLHVGHLVDWCPDVLPYLELPPGWRFLIAPGYEDVWFDPRIDLTPSGSEA